jgi:hypothetical protein
MPVCCDALFIGWICPRCGASLSFENHTGSNPVSIGSIQSKNVTINKTLVQGDLIAAGGIKSTGEHMGLSPSGLESLPPPPDDFGSVPPPPTELGGTPPPLPPDLDPNLPPPPSEVASTPPPLPSDLEPNLPPPPSEVASTPPPLPSEAETVGVHSTDV